MEVVVQNKMEEPEKSVTEAARNDYMEEFIGDLSHDEIMETVDPDDHDYQRVEEVVMPRYPDKDTLGEEGYNHLLERHAKRRTLIRHLLNNGHFGPFEHPKMIIAVKGVSRSLMAQITRHRHVSFDVRSMRYVSFEDSEPGELFVTPQTIEDIDSGGRNPHGVSLEDVKARTGMSKDGIEEARQKVFQKSVRESLEDYKKLVNLGTPPEDARFVLPIGSKVNMVFSLNARMLMHVADMRAAADAQWEVRHMTERVLEEAREWMPITFDFYEEEMKNRKNRLAP